MKVWLIQSVLSPYRIPLFERIARTPGIDFRLILLSDRFKTRPHWKRDISKLPFEVEVPVGFSYQTGPEHQYCLNPFLLWKMVRERPDVIICGGYSLATLNAWLYRMILGGRYVIWTEATMHTDGWISGLQLCVRRMLSKGAASFVDAGSLAREYVRYLRADLPESKVFRAFNCVDNRHFAHLRGDNHGFLTLKGFPDQNLLFVGKLNERKGIPTLLEVYQLVVSRLNRALGLILIGDGPLQSHVEHFRQLHQLRHIYLEGWLQNDATANYYASASAFMLLSSVDHNPLVLFEALASGLPIICSQGACNAIDFVKEGVNGYIVDPEDIPTVARCTIDVLNWDEARRKECEGYSRKVVEKANYADAAQAFIDACQFAVQACPAKEAAPDLAKIS